MAVSPAPMLAFGLFVGLAVSRADEVDRRIAEIRGKLRQSTSAAALIEAGRLASDFPTDARAFRFRAALFSLERRHIEAERDFSRAIELDPKDIESFQRRGEVRFRLGDIEGSVEDFDAVLTLDPRAKPGHWQRGISLYYAKRFADGVAQFDLHQTVNPQDVENAVWRFLCMAPIEGIEAARKKLIPIDADDRVPMAEIHRLFAGRSQPEAVLQAAEAPTLLPEKRARQRFYANLYLGLYYEAVGDAARSMEYIEKAANEKLAMDYMGDVARTHRLLRSKQPKERRSTDRRDGNPAAEKAKPDSETKKAAPPAPAKKAASQNPSPMVEHTRSHPRIERLKPAGQRFPLKIGTLFLPASLSTDNGAAARESSAAARTPTPLFVHFHGGDWLPEYAAARTGNRAVISVQLGSGSSVYAKPFQERGAFTRLLAEAASRSGRAFQPVGLTGWSAGYGAIRAILSEPSQYEKIDFVILLDGMHTDYVDGKPGPLESRLRTEGLEIFLTFARDAAAGKKRFIITHSEVFPGTFASTTETADWLIASLGLKRRATLEWGPMGMQQLSEIISSGLTIRGYAGNSAPDHVDHLHALPDILRWLD